MNNPGLLHGQPPATLEGLPERSKVKRTLPRVHALSVKAASLIL